MRWTDRKTVAGGLPQGASRPRRVGLTGNGTEEGENKPSLLQWGRGQRRDLHNGTVRGGTSASSYCHEMDTYCGRHLVNTRAVLTDDSLKRHGKGTLEEVA